MQGTFARALGLNAKQVTVNHAREDRLCCTRVKILSQRPILRAVVSLLEIRKMHLVR